MTRSLLAEDPDALVAPYLMSGGTDAKHFRQLGMRSYGFAPLRLPADLDFTALFHGVDERVPGRRAGVRRAGLRPVPRPGLSRPAGAGQTRGCRSSGGRNRMILRRSTTRRVPSGPIRTRSSSQPPCSARSTSSRVTTLREKSRGMTSLLELPLHPAGRAASHGPPRGRHLRPPDTSSRASTISAGRVSSSTARARPQLGGGAGADDRGGHAGPVADPGQRHLAAGDQPSPSAARATASTMPGAALVEVGADEAGEVRRCGPGVRRRTGAVLAGQHAAAQRRPGQDAEAERLRPPAAPRARRRG